VKEGVKGREGKGRPVNGCAFLLASPRKIYHTQQSTSSEKRLARVLPCTAVTVWKTAKPLPIRRATKEVTPGSRLPGSTRLRRYHSVAEKLARRSVGQPPTKREQTRGENIPATLAPHLENICLRRLCVASKDKPSALVREVVRSNPPSMLALHKATARL